MKSYCDVDAWLDDRKRWRDESEVLRAYLLDCGLGEEVKWGKPCYTHDGNNVALIQPFRDFLALMFFKGVLLKAKKGVLESQGDNTHASRRVCFRSVDDVKKMERTVRDLVRQAVKVEKAGTPLPDRDALVLVPELKARLDGSAKLRKAFAKLTPGRQRAYHLLILERQAVRHPRKACRRVRADDPGRQGAAGSVTRRAGLPLTISRSRARARP